MNGRCCLVSESSDSQWCYRNMAGVVSIHLYYSSKLHAMRTIGLDVEVVIWHETIVKCSTDIVASLPLASPAASGACERYKIRSSEACRAYGARRQQHHRPTFLNLQCELYRRSPARLAGGSRMLTTPGAISLVAAYQANHLILTAHLIKPLVHTPGEKSSYDH